MELSYSERVKKPSTRTTKVYQLTSLFYYRNVSKYAYHFFSKQIRLNHNQLGTQ